MSYPPSEDDDVDPAAERALALDELFDSLDEKSRAELAKLGQAS